MPILLFTLLAIAVCITIAGLVLSSRSSEHHTREINATGRTTQIEKQPVRVRRTTATTTTTATQPSPRRAQTTTTTAIQPSPRRVRTTTTAAIKLSPRRAQMTTATHILPSAPTIGQRVIKSGLTSWVGIGLVLLALFFFGFYSLSHTFPNSVLLGAPSWLTFPAATQPVAQNTSIPTGINASRLVVRIGQLDPTQYSSKAEYDKWAYSTCSTAAMAEVMNAYGRHYRVTDVLQIENQVGAITPELGLLDPGGIERTGAQFGFQTTWGMKMTLDQLIATANAGKPVIVSFPPEVYAGGHIVVVTGGDSNNVLLSDSSLYNRHSLTHDQFMQWWRGFVAIMTPK